MAKVAVLARAAEPGDRAREAHHRDDLATGAHAGVAAGPRRVADDRHLEAEARALVEEPHAGSHRDGNERAEGDHEPMDRPARPRRLVRQRLALWEDARLEARGVA